MSDATVTIDGHEIELSHLAKVYFAEAGITKGDIVDYYRKVAEVMLPHLAGRPVSMQRFPGGIDGESFYQKRVPDYFPEWIETARLKTEDGGEIEQVVVSNAATLVYLANQACLTFHTWLSRIDDIDRPDRLVFDLDPSGQTTFDDVVFAAQELRKKLDGVALPNIVMTTGSRGLHVVVPLERRHTFDEVRGWAKAFADELVEQHPDRLTTRQRKAQRGDRIFIDYLRNAYAQTSVAPYSVRARPGAPIAAPVEWDEVSTSGFDPQKWTVRNVFRRLGQRDDPWRELPAGARLPL